LDSNSFIIGKKVSKSQGRATGKVALPKNPIVLSHLKTWFSFLIQRSCSTEQTETVFPPHCANINRVLIEEIQPIHGGLQNHTHIKAKRSNATDPWASCPIRETLSS